MIGVETTADFTLEFDLGVYSLVAIQKAAYSFGDRFSVEIKKPDASTVQVVLTAKRRLPDIGQVPGEFRNEVLDQHLRQIVLNETSGIRDLLIAQAFSRTNLIMPELDSTPAPNQASSRDT